MDMDVFVGGLGVHVYVCGCGICVCACATSATSCSHRASLKLRLDKAVLQSMDTQRTTGVSPLCSCIN